MIKDSLLVKIENLKFSYSANNKKIEVIREFNLDVYKNEFIAIVGPSGCGKSTLLNLIAGLLKPDHGNIELYNKNDSFFGYLFQKDTLLPWKTVYDNIAFPLTIRKYSKYEINEKVTKWIQLIGLEGFENSYPGQISQGMKKRVALAAALIYEPKIVLMDEPFSALDILTRETIENEVLKIWEKLKTTIIFVTHDLSEAIALSDRVVILTKLPAIKKTEYKINLPRPRNLVGISQDDVFHTIYKEIWTIFVEEVSIES